MRIKNMERVRYPIVYIAIGLLLSSLIYGEEGFSKLILGILILGILYFIKVEECIEFSVLIGIVITLGFIINNSFYNLSVNTEENVRITKISTFKSLGELKGRVLNLEGDLKGYKKGDSIKISGEFTREINKENGVIGNFKISNSQLNKNSIFTILTGFRERLKNKLRENIGSRKTALISSMLFGKDEFLDRDDNEDMKRYGIIHAMSVSGFHVALIFLVIKTIFKEKIALGVTFIYVILTGMAFSSIRAFIMLLLVCFSVPLRKSKNGIGALSLSAIIIFFMKPYCIFSIGFRLSFLGVLGIILFSKKINNKIYKIFEPIRSAISVTLAAQILTLPVIIINFNEISINSLIGNLLLIPFINLMLILGVVLIMTNPIPQIFDFVSFLLIKTIEYFDHIMIGLDYISTSEIYLYKEVGYFYIVALFTYYFYKKGLKKIIYIMPISLGLILISLYSFNLKLEFKIDGTIIASYRGKRIGIINKIRKDTLKIEKKNLLDDVYVDFQKLKIGDNYLEKEGANYKLTIEDKEVFLNLGREKIDNKYDIINLKESNINKIIIIENKIFKLDI